MGKVLLDDERIWGEAEISQRRVDWRAVFDDANRFPTMCVQILIDQVQMKAVMRLFSRLRVNHLPNLQPAF
jgi:hypothetical protein